MTTPTIRAPRRDSLNNSIKADERGLIDRAAELSGKTRTDFVLDAARWAAVEALTDHSLFSDRTSRCFIIPGSFSESGRASSLTEIPDSSFSRNRTCRRAGSASAENVRSIADVRYFTM